MIGLTYMCGCGEVHAVGGGVVPIRDLRRIPVHTVLASAACGWFTLVKVKGWFRAKRLDSIVSTEIRSDEDGNQLAEGTLAAQGVGSVTARAFLAAREAAFARAAEIDDDLLRETAEWVARGFYMNRTAHPEWGDERNVAFMLSARYSSGVTTIEELQLRTSVWADFRAAPSLESLLRSILINEGAVSREESRALLRAAEHLRTVSDKLGLDAAREMKI